MDIAIYIRILGIGNFQILLYDVLKSLNNCLNHTVCYVLVNNGKTYDIFLFGVQSENIIHIQINYNYNNCNYVKDKSQMNANQIEYKTVLKNIKSPVFDAEWTRTRELDKQWYMYVIIRAIII